MPYIGLLVEDELDALHLSSDIELIFPLLRARSSTQGHTCSKGSLLIVAVRSCCGAEYLFYCAEMEIPKEESVE